MVTNAQRRFARHRDDSSPPPRELVARRKVGGDGGLEALRVLKRRLSDVIYQALRTDVIARQAATS
jgi:transposase